MKIVVNNKTFQEYVLKPFKSFLIKMHVKETLQNHSAIYTEHDIAKNKWLIFALNESF